MNRFRLSFFLVLTLMVAHVTSHGAENRIVNGSFELGEYKTPGFERVFPGEKLIQGWEVGGAGVDWHVGTANTDVNPNFQNPHFGPAKDGSLAIDLNLDGNASGWIQQTFHTVPGMVYNVSFQMAASNWFSYTRSVVVSVNDAEYDYSVPGSNRYDLQWYNITFSFIANESWTTLRFSSPDDNGFWGPIIDDVQVYPNDIKPPAVVRCEPVFNKMKFVGMEFDFSESVNPAKGTLSKATYELISTGPDLKFGTADDFKLDQYSIVVGKNRVRHRVKMAKSAKLAYPMRFTIFRSGVFDRSENQMANNQVMYFNKAAGLKK